jgi:hypothetical protein
MIGPTYGLLNESISVRSIPLNAIVAQPSSVHLFAELLSVIPDSLTGKSEAIARSPIKFYLLSNTLIKGQEALVL